eukprot:515212-Rhodomonas_salina.1
METQDCRDVASSDGRGGRDEEDKGDRREQAHTSSEHLASEPWQRLPSRTQDAASAPRCCTARRQHATRPGQR